MLQSWHSLSDAQLEEALKVRIDFMLFVGIGVEHNTPDKTTICRFRNRLVNKGNTIVVIEHNMDVIKMADYIIDIGYEGGRGGGMIVAAGSPEEVAKDDKSYTAFYLNKEFDLKNSKLKLRG